MSPTGQHSPPSRNRQHRRANGCTGVRHEQGQGSGTNTTSVRLGEVDIGDVAPTAISHRGHERLATL
jgi:hypothetical protein